MRPRRGALCVLQRLGCLRRRRVWLQHRLGQPRERSRGSPARRPRPATDRPLRHPRSGARLMAHFTTSDGLSLHYTDAGHGQPVLCLAGLTRNSADFGFLTPHLSGCRMICMDYRGRGQSDHAPDFMSYNILREAQDAVELLDHLGIGRVTLIGTSRGGLIAMALSLEHRARLGGVVLNDIGPEVAAEGLGRIMDYVGKTPPYPDLDSAARALKAGNEAAFPGVPLERWREQAEFMWFELPTGGGIGLRYDPRLRDALIGQAGA